MAACGTIPYLGNISVTIPIITSVLNAVSAYHELKTYKEHQSKLNALTDRNMAAADLVRTKNNEIKDKRIELYERLNNREKYDPCCDDAKRAASTVLAPVAESYADNIENLQCGQIGKREAMLRHAMRSIPKANSRVADLMAIELRIQQSIEQDQTRAITTSAFHSDMPSPSIYANLAQTIADASNDAALAFSQFSNEAFRSIGYKMEVNRQERNKLEPVPLNNQQFQVAQELTRQPVYKPASIFGDN